MEFKELELNERIKNVNGKDLISVANDSNPTLFDLKDLSHFLPSSTARYNVLINNVTYEVLMTPSEKKRLFVFLSDNYKIGTEERKRQAIFFRMTWHKYFPGICVNIEDPMVKKYNNIGWGGYLGDEENFYVDGVVDIVKQIAKNYGIIYENITFLGLSSAGFAAIHAATKIPYSSCVAENPQIYVENWTDIKKLQESLGANFKEPKYRERLDLDEAIIHNRNSRIRIFCNSASKLDFDMQLKPLLNKLGIKEIRYNYYKLNNLEVYFLNTPNGHVTWLTPLSVYMASRFDLYSTNERNFILLMMSDLNRELYDLRKKKDVSKYSRLYNLMKTARLDVKNRGMNNSVNVTNLGNQSSHIIFPEWYKDEFGEGCIITGSDGKFHVKIKCIGIVNVEIDCK